MAGLNVDVYDINNYNEHGLLMGIIHPKPPAAEVERGKSRKRTAGGRFKCRTKGTKRAKAGGETAEVPSGSPPEKNGEAAERPSGNDPAPNVPKGNENGKEKEREDGRKAPEKAPVVPKLEFSDDEESRRYDYNDEEIQILPNPPPENSDSEDEIVNTTDRGEGKPIPNEKGDGSQDVVGRDGSQEVVRNGSPDASTPEIDSQEIPALQRPQTTGAPQKISQKTAETGNSGDIFDETPEVVEDEESDGVPPPVPPRDYDRPLPSAASPDRNLDNSDFPLDLPAGAPSPACLDSPVAVSPAPLPAVIFSDSDVDEDVVVPPRGRLLFPAAPVASPTSPMAPETPPVADVAPPTPVAPSSPPVALATPPVAPIAVASPPQSPVVARPVTLPTHVAPAVVRPVVPKPKKFGGGGRAKKPPVKKLNQDDSVPGIIAEIRRLQRSTNTLISRAAFSRLVREISTDLVNTRNFAERIAPVMDTPPKWQSSALTALQEATEMYMSGVMEDSNLLAIHAGRVTIKPADIKLVMHLRGLKDAGNPLYPR